MDRKTKRFWAAALCLAFLLCVPAAKAAAATTIRTIKATFMGIRVFSNGEEVKMEDAEGNRLFPFIYNGNTYVPIRALAEALEKEVTWDEARKIVYIGDLPDPHEGEAWLQRLPPYALDGAGSYILDGTDEERTVSVAGLRYDECVFLSRSEEDESASAVWNTENQYKTITFRIGHADATVNADATVAVYRDGKALASMTLGWSDPSKKIRIPISTCSNVRIEILTEVPEAAYALYDIVFE